MNDIFTNLVSRHLGTCETVRPRTPGSFESIRGNVTPASTDEEANREISERDQPAHERHITPLQPKKKADSEMNPLESVVVNTDRTMDARSAFSVVAPKVTGTESCPIGHNTDYLSHSLPDQGDPAVEPGVTDQSAVSSDSNIMPGEPYNARPSDSLRTSHLGAVEQEQPHKAAAPTPLEDEAVTSGHMQENVSESYEIARLGNSQPAPALFAGEHYLEYQLSHRIGELLQRLAVDPVSPGIEPALDERNSQSNVSRISISPEAKDFLSDLAFAPMNPTLSSSRQATGEGSSFSADEESIFLNAQIEPPFWLPQIEAQIDDRLQQIETKAEPTINVTIGRVEVRAVQTESPKSTKRQQNITGVMTLGEYLKQREGSGAG